MIYRAINNCILLFATRPGVESVWGRFDHQRPSFGTDEIIVLAAVIILLAGSLAWQMMRRRYQREFWYNSTSRLFSELCHAHRLDRSNRRLLKQLAAARGLKNATELFVEPDYFDAATLPPTLKSSASDFRQLRHQLFD